MHNTSKPDLTVTGEPEEDKCYCLRPGLDRFGKRAWEDQQFTRCSRTLVHVLVCEVTPPLFLDT